MYCLLFCTPVLSTRMMHGPSTQCIFVSGKLRESIVFTRKMTCKVLSICWESCLCLLLMQHGVAGLLCPSGLLGLDAGAGTLAESHGAGTVETPIP